MRVVDLNYHIAVHRQVYIYDTSVIVNGDAVACALFRLDILREKPKVNILHNNIVLRFLHGNDTKRVHVFDIY